MNTLGARDFSSAVSCFCQVFIVTRAFFRGFGLRPKMCRPSANTENSRRTREKPLVPSVGYERWQTSNRKTKVLQPLGDCVVLLDLSPLGISVALREGGWGGGGGVWSWIISGTIHIFLLPEQNG